MGLYDLYEAGKTRLNGVPLKFEFDVNSTLHNRSSLDGSPAFSTYARPYLRTLKPTALSTGTLNPKKYLDKPPR
jgi:hypothetical protein